jgi:hypothetical protein
MTTFWGETDGEDEELTGPVAPPVVAIQDGKALQAQILLRHKTGHRVPVQLWAFPIRNAEGAIIGAAESFEESVSVTDWDRWQNQARHLRMYRSGQRRSQSRDDPVSCAGKSCHVCRASRPVLRLVMEKKGHPFDTPGRLLGREPLGVDAPEGHDEGCDA